MGSAASARRPRLDLPSPSPSHRLDFHPTTSRTTPTHNYGIQTSHPHHHHYPHPSSPRLALAPPDDTHRAPLACHARDPGRPTEISGDARDGRAQSSDDRHRSTCRRGRRWGRGALPGAVYWSVRTSSLERGGGRERADGGFVERADTTSAKEVAPFDLSDPHHGDWVQFHRESSTRRRVEKLGG